MRAKIVSVIDTALMAGKRLDLDKELEQVQQNVLVNIIEIADI